MPSVTIITPEDANDAIAIKILSKKYVDYLNAQRPPKEQLRVSFKYPNPSRLSEIIKDVQSLKKATHNYLQQDKYVLFFIDRDGYISLEERKNQPNSLYNKIQAVLNDPDFKDRVYLVLMVNELEAWLLIDCVGICVYFLEKHNKCQANCRSQVEEESKWQPVRASQVGDTELIEEPELGGKGAKEKLKRFSKKILHIINPNLPDRNLKESIYRESISHNVAEYIEINKTTIRRNASLGTLGKYLAQCANP